MHLLQHLQQLLPSNCCKPKYHVNLHLLPLPVICTTTTTTFTCRFWQREQASNSSLCNTSAAVLLRTPTTRTQKKPEHAPKTSASRVFQTTSDSNVCFCVLLQFVLPVHLADHSYCHRGRISARRADSDRKPRASCRDQQQHSAHPPRPAQKRKRTSAARPSTSSAEHLVPRPRSPIPPADLPLVSDEAPGPRPSTAPLQPDGDLNIYNRPVEEFQLIYHAVVDDMLKFKSGRPRPYSLELGRRLKQKLWERLDRPSFTESVHEDGRMHVDMSVGGDRVYPPLYDVDTSGEPEPGRPPVKRARKQSS
nr:uncharacterized protein LOC114922143 [Labrus bergylta]